MAKESGLKKYAYLSYHLILSSPRTVKGNIWAECDLTKTKLSAYESQLFDKKMLGSFEIETLLIVLPFVYHGLSDIWLLFLSLLAFSPHDLLLIQKIVQ